MADLAGIRAAIARALEAIPDLRVVDYVQHSVEPPMAEVGWPIEIEYDQTMGRGVDRYTMPIRIYVGAADDQAASLELAEFLHKDSAKSVKAAVERTNAEGRRLEGLVHDCRVARMTSAGWAQVAGAWYLAADWVVDIYA